VKICYLADIASIHTVRWAKYFASKGHEVHVISFGTSGENAVDNVNLHLLPMSRHPILHCDPIKVRRLIKRIEPDILHAHYIVGYGLLGALSGFHPFILSVWGSDVLAAPKSSKLANLEVRFTLGKADMVTAQAEFMGSYLMSEFKLPQSKFIRVPWGIDLSIFHRGYEADVIKLKKDLQINESSPVILSNRNMAPEYEIGSIIDAVPHVVHKHPNAIFVILRGYGSEKFEEERKSRAETLGVMSNIRFVSKLMAPEEIPVYLNMADAFMSIPKYGQFGISILEGMACGAIPILSNIAVHKELVVDNENALLVNPENPEEIAEKISYCIEHPELRDRFYRINKGIVEEKENWDKNAKEMGKLYERLVSKTS
jgi:glycosyltransferase involved in cell wall biosynthesis